MKVTPQGTDTRADHLKVWVKVEGTGGSWIRFLTIAIPFSMLDGALPHVLQGWRMSKEDDAPPWDEPPMF